MYTWLSIINYHALSISKLCKEHGCYSHSLSGSTCLKKHMMQFVKHFTDERILFLSYTSSCILESSTLCFLLPSAVAPVVTEKRMYTQVNQDHLQPVNVCQSVIHSSLVMALFQMLLCFVLTEKKEQQEDKPSSWIYLSDCMTLYPQEKWIIFCSLLHIVIAVVKRNVNGLKLFWISVFEQ